MNRPSERSPKAGSKEAARKPYRTPRLARLGTLLELTTAVGNRSGKNDHSGGPIKTQ